MASEIRTGSAAGNPSTESIAKNLDIAASEISAIQAIGTLHGVGTVSAVTPTGSVQGDAAALSNGLNVVTGADGTKGVILPAAAAGKQVRIKNVTGFALKVWPATGDGINAVAVNGSYSMAASTSVILEAADATTWYTFPLVAS